MHSKRGMIIFGMTLVGSLMSCQVTVPVKSPRPAIRSSAVTSTQPVEASMQAGGARVPQKMVLTGVLRLPPSLVSNNGGSAASNNGGSVVSNNGGSGIAPQGGYRLFGLAQTPVSGVVVEVFDANGQAVRASDGQVMRAVTDAEGRFVVSGELPVNNLVLRAKLAAERGSVAAIATRDTRDQPLSLDLISTLTTNYILERYVVVQSDRQNVLDRLPGTVERETRERALQAFEATGSAVPPALDSGQLLTVTEALRRDTAFDSQMETVKRLLIAAGQSDLGAGRQATEVVFGEISDFIHAPDGSLYLIEDDRLRRVRPDGVLETLSGGGTLRVGDVDGRSLKEVSVDEGIQHLAIDNAGRLLFKDRATTLARLDADDTVRVLSRDYRLSTIVSGTAGEIYGAAKGSRAGEGWIVYSRDGQGAFRTVGTVNLPDQVECDVVAHDAKKGLLLSLSIRPAGSRRFQEQRQWHWMNATTGELQRLEPGATTVRAVTPEGHLVVDAADGHLALMRVNSDVTTAFAWQRSYNALRLSGDGRALILLSDENVFYRVTPEGALAFAGRPSDAATANKAADLSLYDPVAMAVDTLGQIYLLDARLHKLLRIDTSQLVHEVALGRDASVLENDLGQLSALRAGPDGAIYAKVPRGIRAIQPGSDEQVFYTPPNKGIIEDFAMGADGSLWVLLTYTNAPHQLLRRTSDGVVTTVWTGATREVQKVDKRTGAVSTSTVPEPNLRQRNVGVTPEGRVWLYGGGQLAYLDVQSQTWQIVKKDVRYNRPDQNGDGARDAMAIGGDGNIYLTGGDMGNGFANQLWRIDPVTMLETIIAGDGGQIFNGTGIDDGIDYPYNPVFEPSGDLLFIDNGARQVKRIPKDKLRGGQAVNSASGGADTEE